MEFLAQHRKLIVAIIGAGLTWGLQYYAGNDQVYQWLSLIAAVLTAAGVYQARNNIKVD